MLLRFPVLLLLACAGVGAQQYPFIPIAGSPKNIEHILQDHKGRIWIGTHDDVLCFDGSRFFSLHDLGFPHTPTDTLAEDAEGGILISSMAGVYRLFNGRMEKLLPEVADARVVAVAPGLAVVWFLSGTTHAVVSRLRRIQGAWQLTELTAWRIGEFLTRDRNGAVLSACPGGWCEYSRCD